MSERGRGEPLERAVRRWGPALDLTDNVKSRVGQGECFAINVAIGPKLGSQGGASVSNHTAKGFSLL